MAPVLCRLFHLILKTSVYPKSWKHSLVQPISNKDDHSIPFNFRTIALTSAVAKVFEFILNSQCLKYLKFHCQPSDHQYGFHNTRSTLDLLLSHSHLVILSVGYWRIHAYCNDPPLSPYILCLPLFLNLVKLFLPL